MTKKGKKIRANKEQHIGGLNDLKNVRGQFPSDAKFSEGSVEVKPKLEDTEYMTRKRQLTNSGFGAQFSGRSVKVYCDQAKPGSDCTSIAVPFKRAKELLTLSLLMEGRSASVKHIDPSKEDVDKFMSEMTIEKLNRIYAFEGNGFISPSLNSVKFTISPF